MVKFFKSFKEYADSGFGPAVENNPERLVNKDGSLNVRRTGLSFFDHLSVFHELIQMSWWRFNLVVIISYILINLFFGLIFYFVGVEGINVEHGIEEHLKFMDAFYFSAQTFSTVGYGRMNPVNPTANIVAVIEMLIGMMYLALAAGLLYGRFSKPVSKIIYSDKALIAPYQGGKGLMFRMSNAKNNLLIEVQVQVLLTMIVKEGERNVRKFYQLDLERSRINMLALSWTVVHPIDDKSPLKNIVEDDIANMDIELMVLVNAMNDTIGQGIHSRTSYTSTDIVYGAKFQPIFNNKNMKTYVAVDRIGDYVKTSF